MTGPGPKEQHEQLGSSVHGHVKLVKYLGIGLAVSMGLCVVGLAYPHSSSSWAEHPFMTVLLGSLLSVTNKAFLQAGPGLVLYVAVSFALYTHMLHGSQVQRIVHVVLPQLLLTLLPELVAQLAAYKGNFPSSEAAPDEPRCRTRDVGIDQPQPASEHSEAGTSSRHVHADLPASGVSAIAKAPASHTTSTIISPKLQAPITDKNRGGSPSSSACNYTQLARPSAYRPFIKGQVQVHVKILTHNQVGDLPQQFGRAILAQLNDTPVADNLLLVNMAVRPGCVMMSLECGLKRTPAAGGATQLQLARAVADALVPYLEICLPCETPYSSECQDERQYLCIQVGQLVTSVVWDPPSQSWQVKEVPASRDVLLSSQLGLIRQHPTRPITATPAHDPCTTTPEHVHVPVQVQLLGNTLDAPGLSGWTPPAPGTHCQHPGSNRTRGVLRVLASHGGRYLTTRVTGCEIIRGTTVVEVVIQVPGAAAHTHHMYMLLPVRMQLWLDEVMLSSAPALLHLGPSPAAAPAPALWQWGAPASTLRSAIAELQTVNDKLWEAGEEYEQDNSSTAHSTMNRRETCLAAAIDSHHAFLLELLVWLQEVQERLRERNGTCVMGCRLQSAGPQLAATWLGGPVLDTHQLGLLRDQLLAHTRAHGMMCVHTVLYQQYNAVVSAGQGRGLPAQAGAAALLPDLVPATAMSTPLNSRLALLRHSLHACEQCKAVLQCKTPCSA